MKIETGKKSIKFSVNGEIANGEMEFRENNSDNENECISIEVEKPTIQNFSLTFLNSFCKAASLSSRVKLCLSDQTPLLLEFGMADLGELKFYLAPKLSEN